MANQLFMTFNRQFFLLLNKILFQELKAGKGKYSTFTLLLPYYKSRGTISLQIISVAEEKELRIHRRFTVAIQ